MNIQPLLRVALIAAGCAVVMTAAAAPKRDPHDYPTTERVEWVQACMAQHPDKSHYEMISKCSCAIDKIAAEVPFSEYDTMSTATKANSIGGERGNNIRDAPVMQKAIKRYKAVTAAAHKACFISDEPK